MGFFRFLIWTSASVAFGIFLGGADIAGSSPAEHLYRLWQSHGSTTTLAQVRDGVAGALMDAKTKPSEHYSSEDKEALNKIVAKRGPGPK